MSVLRSTVSKAADRSSNVKAARSPRSSASRTSLITRNIAVSVEWLARYADCSVGISFHALRWSISCRVTISRSSNFDKTLRFDIGRYDFPSDGSRFGFFSIGVMNAALKCDGNTPDDSDLLNSSVMNGASTSTLSFKRLVGSGSVAHCLSGSLQMAAMTSSLVRTRKAALYKLFYCASACASMQSAIWFYTGSVRVSVHDVVVLYLNECTYCQTWPSGKIITAYRSSLKPTAVSKFQREPLSGGVKYTRVRKNLRFSTVITFLFRKRYELGLWLPWIINRKS